MVGRYGGVPQHIIPSSVMAKPCFKTRYLEEPWSPEQNGQWNLTSTDTDKVQVLRSRGDDGYAYRLHPIELVFQSRPPLPRQRQSRINSMILCQVHVGQEK